MKGRSAQNFTITKKGFQLKGMDLNKFAGSNKKNKNKEYKKEKLYFRFVICKLTPRKKQV